MNGFEYVSLLSDEEKVLFLRLIIKIIGSDGQIDDVEKQFIRELAKQYRIPAEFGEQIHAPCETEELFAQAEQMLDRRKSLYLIKELLSVANTDNDFSENEIDFVINIANRLKIEDDKVVAINQLVIERLNWLNRYQEIMEIKN
ncbi:MAG: DUF533 domain-containing protein [Alphaproteobacteria bacterium]|nr:DUF533 domain-containing protein [Alphaproteobacteria bacterium]